MIVLGAQSCLSFTHRKPNLMRLMAIIEQRSNDFFAANAPLGCTFVLWDALESAGNSLCDHRRTAHCRIVQKLKVKGIDAWWGFVSPFFSLVLSNDFPTMDGTPAK